MIIKSVYKNIKEAESFKVGHMKNIISDLLILCNLHISSLAQQAIVMVSVSWLKLPIGWIKINTDGVARGPLGMVGVRKFF